MTGPSRRIVARPINSDPVSYEKKVDALRILFPDKSYAISQIAEFLHGCEKTTMRWLRYYEIPTVKFTGSPMVLRDNLIKFLIIADTANENEDDLVGLKFCINDSLMQKKMDK